MEKIAIYLGTVRPFKNKEIIITGETPKFWKFKVVIRGLTPAERSNARYDYNFHPRQGFYSGTVSKKNVKLHDILPDTMFTI